MTSGMTNGVKLLLVDDDGEATLSLLRALRAAGLAGEAQAAGTVEKALEILREFDPDVAVIDLTLDPRVGVESGFKLLQRMLADSPRCRVIVLTGSASLAHGVRALNMGAAHFLEKPADPQHLLALIKDSASQAALRREFEKLQSRSENSVLQQVVGVSHAIQRVRSELAFAASNNQTLLITGETGTGKGLCARVVHQLSARSAQRLVRYQPSFANADLVNSDLFGHAKGAFTGANNDRRGLLAEAHRGTLFLDELDELPLQTQVTLLGVLQDRTYRAVGSSNEEIADIRLICASNQDLESCVRAGKLRQDFFHRVAHARLRLPPLRERKEDLAVLASGVLSELRAREQVAVFDISDSALEKLRNYEWPGNVRELEAVMEGGAYRAQYARRRVLEPQDLQLAGADAPSSARASGALSFGERVEAFKLELIQEALTRQDGNQARAATELGLDRSTLRRILSRTQSPHGES